MTKETYTKARELNENYEHISQILDLLTTKKAYDMIEFVKKGEGKCSSSVMVDNYVSNIIIEALNAEREKLLTEFERL